MHDTLGYFGRDPVYRKYHQNDLTFAMLYHHNENFVLPLSHDEVVHGKGSLLGRMPGDDWQKFANLRALFGYQWTFPGKPLLFMGGEFGQRAEWNANAGLDWHLLGQGPYHSGLLRFVEDLNKLYLARTRALGSGLRAGRFLLDRLRGPTQQRALLRPPEPGPDKRAGCDPEPDAYAPDQLPRRAAAAGPLARNVEQ